MIGRKIFVVSLFFVMIMLAVAGCQAAGPSSPAATSRPTAELAAVGATPGAPAGEAPPSPAPTQAITPTPTVTASPSPTNTPAPTATATPTATPTPIPTLPPEQVGGLSGVPDPLHSDPDLFDLTDPDAPIPQFVHAFTEAGIDIQGEDVANNLEFATIEDKDGNPVIVATTKVDKFSGKYADLNGNYPLFIATQNEKGEWEWKEVLPKNNPFAETFVTISGGDHISAAGLSKVKFFDGVGFTSAFSEMYMGQYGNPDRWLKEAKKNNSSVLIHSVFGKRIPEGTVINENYVEQRMRVIFTKLKEYGYGKDGLPFTLVVVNEPFYNDDYGKAHPGWNTNLPYYHELGEQEWIVNAYMIMWKIAQEERLKPGVDFQVIGINGLIAIDMPAVEPINSFYIQQAKMIRRELSKKLKTSESEVPFDLGAEYYIGPGAATIRSTVPLEELDDSELVKRDELNLIDKIDQEMPGSQLWITEYSINASNYSDNESFLKSAKIIKKTLVPFMSRIQGLMLWRPLSRYHLGQDTSSTFPNYFFDINDSSTIAYYAYLQTLFSK